MVPPRYDDDTVPPSPDPTPMSFLRPFLRHADDARATLAIEMEIFVREVWIASLATVGDHRRARRLGRERAWLEGQLSRRAPTVDGAGSPR